MIATKTLLLMVRGLAGRENSGKAKIVDSCVDSQLESWLGIWASSFLRRPPILNLNARISAQTYMLCLVQKQEGFSRHITNIRIEYGDLTYY